MIYWLTGATMLNPVVASIWATCIILFISSVISWINFTYLKRKLLRILDSCLGLESRFNKEDEIDDLFKRIKDKLEKCK